MSGRLAEDRALVSVFSHGSGEVEDDGDGAASGRCSPSGQLLPLQLPHPPLDATDRRASCADRTGRDLVPLCAVRKDTTTSCDMSLTAAVQLVVILFSSLFGHEDTKDDLTFKTTKDSLESEDCPQ